MVFKTRFLLDVTFLWLTIESEKKKNPHTLYIRNYKMMFDSKCVSVSKGCLLYMSRSCISGNVIECALASKQTNLLHVAL